jgi:hypothetical protein
LQYQRTKKKIGAVAQRFSFDQFSTIDVDQINEFVYQTSGTLLVDQIIAQLFPEPMLLSHCLSC